MFLILAIIIAIIIVIAYSYSRYAHRRGMNGFWMLMHTDVRGYMLIEPDNVAYISIPDADFEQSFKFKFSYMTGIMRSDIGDYQIEINQDGLMFMRDEATVMVWEKKEDISNQLKGRG